VAQDDPRLLALAQQDMLARCSADGLTFLRFVKTRDEADPEQSIKPFPTQKEYIRELWDIFSTEQRIVIAKSRQMMVSWVACAFALWWAMFKANQYVVWQTQKEDDAIKMVCTASGDKDTGYQGRIQFLYRNLPSWLRASVRATESEGKLNFSNGSLIEAVAGGANKIRGKTASLLIEDEFAFQDEAKSVYTAIAPLVQRQTKLIMISTPNGSEGSMFYHCYTGTPFA
jgi:hypothetical protein